MTILTQIRTRLHASITIPKERHSMFFKTEPGSYGAHDKFIGVTVPVLRTIAKQFPALSLEELTDLISSPINEERLLALFILTAQYKKSDDLKKETLYQFYLSHLKQVNNWNLVDSSAHLIIGAHLMGKDRSLLITLACSQSLWERRIAIIATWHFIRNNDLTWTFDIAKLLLSDTHDLIHKAVGWMLRETGKKDEAQLVLFLDRHAARIPRTMLRYAIEKFPENVRKPYLLNKKIS